MQSVGQLWTISAGEGQPWRPWGELEGEEAAGIPAAGPKDTATGEGAQHICPTAGLIKSSLSSIPNSTLTQVSAGGGHVQGMLQAGLQSRLLLTWLLSSLWQDFEGLQGMMKSPAFIGDTALRPAPGSTQSKDS